MMMPPGMPQQQPAMPGSPPMGGVGSMGQNQAMSDAVRSQQLMALLTSLQAMAAGQQQQQGAPPPGAGGPPPQGPPPGQGMPGMPMPAQGAPFRG